MNESNNSSGGYWVLLGLFALLAAPVVIDYIVHPSAANAEVEAAK